MSTTTTGPGVAASWRVVQVPPYLDHLLPSRHRKAVLLTPDAGNGALARGAQSAVYYAVPDRPFVALNAAGRPIFSLTLMLSRAPAIHEQSVHHLIQQGLINFDLSLEISAACLETLSSAADLTRDGGNVEVRPLFVREARFKLQSEASVIATTLSTGGTAVHASLQATLDREQTLGLLAALDGGVSNLKLFTEITYRAWGATRRRLAGDWLDIYDFILQRINSADDLTRAQLQALFDQMIQAGVLMTGASTPTNSVAVGASISLFDAFVRQSIIILKRLTPDLAGNDPENRYILRARPNAGFQLEHEEEFSGDSLETLKIETPVETVLNGLLEGLDRDAFIKLVSVGGGGNGHNGSGGIAILPRPQRFVTPAGPRWAGDTAGRTSRARPVSEKIAMAMSDGEMRSVALQLRPEVTSALDRNAQAMIVSGVAKPLAQDNSALAGVKLNWALDDLQFTNHSKERPRHLPIVFDANDPIWPDRLDPHQLWYAPTFELLQPAPNSSPQSSPFQFTFRRVGETESGPALEGEIRFTLRRGMGAKTVQALQPGGLSASPVPTNNLAVSLVLPFINSNDNTLTRLTCPCTISSAGDDVVATVALTTQWVRIAYTVLSNPSASSEPARLSVAFSYEAYTPLRRFDVNVAFGNKAALIPLVFSAEQMREVQGRTFMDARTGTLNFAEGSVLLKREAILLAPGPPSRDERANLRASFARARPQAEVEVADVEDVEEVEVKKPKSATLGHIAKPVVRPSIEVDEIISETALARRTFLRQEQHDAVFPCNVLGAFYRETSDGADLAVGCRRALELGQVSYRRYERIPELDSVVNGEAIFQVYRSLQQPGRFLVLPARYVISRHAPDTIDAYKARVLLYSDEDPARAVRTPIIFRADLQPDIDLHARRELDLKLAQLAGRPLVEYPTAIESETTFVFLAMDSTPVSAVRTPDSFSVSISATAADWPLLFTRLQNGGVVGQVRFILGDGTELSSNLMVHLREITGPWTSGAVTAEQSGDAVRLTNRIDRPASVHDLMIVSDNKSRLVPVERMLAAGDSEMVVIESLPNQAELYPVYTTPATPEAIEAVPNAIERIHINVLFTNQILFSAHNLAALDLFARRTGSQISEQIHVGPETTVVQADFLLPLTEYISEPAIELRIVKTFSDGHHEIKEWFNWELNTMGFVVSLTWDLVQ